MNLKNFIGYQTEPAIQGTDVAEECSSHISDMLCIHTREFFGSLVG